MHKQSIFLTRWIPEESILFLVEIHLKATPNILIKRHLHFPI